MIFDHPDTAEMARIMPIQFEIAGNKIKFEKRYSTAPGQVIWED